MNNNSCSLDEKILELKLVINKELYEENIIDIGVFRKMENVLLNKLKEKRY